MGVGPHEQHGRQVVDVDGCTDEQSRLVDLCPDREQKATACRLQLSALPEDLQYGKLATAQ